MDGRPDSRFCFARGHLNVECEVDETTVIIIGGYTGDFDSPNFLASVEVIGKMLS